RGPFFESPTSGPPIMSIRCPNCHGLLEVKDDRETGFLCPSCGSTSARDSDSTAAWDGRRLGKFALLEELGSGAFGTVYQARDLELERTVALKIPRADSVPRAEDKDRFLREARSAARLHHPGIVALYDAGQVDNVCYLATEFIQGATLSERLDAGRLGL